MFSAKPTIVFCEERNILIHLFVSFVAGSAVSLGINIKVTDGVYYVHSTVNIIFFTQTLAKKIRFFVKVTDAHDKGKFTRRIKLSINKHTSSGGK